MATTWNFNENAVIETAKKLGIKLTNAELGTEICQCWADRVQWAGVCFDDGRPPPPILATHQTISYRLYKALTDHIG